MKKVIVIVGPTGVGKTKLGVELAKRINGEVISGDSMQIYKGMDIGTAKVTQEEMDGVIHHLIDVKNPDESYSVASFQEETRKKIEEISLRGKMPILVGGTGLYIKAALFDYHFDQEEVNHEAFERKYQDYTNEQLHQYLDRFDHESALTIHPNNRRRVLRAIEIYEKTGKTKTEGLNEQLHQPIYDAFMVGLTLPREILYERINQRVDIMLAQGLEKEVRRLVEEGYDASLQSMKAIGYKEWFDYFEQRKTYEETIEQIRLNSRHYARRQYTWFNHQFSMNWFDVCLENFEKTILDVVDKMTTEQFI